MTGDIAYSIIAQTPVGLHLFTLQTDEILGLEWARSVNRIGILKLLLDANTYPFDSIICKRDTRLVVVRTFTGVTSQIAGETTWFVRRAQLQQKAGMSDRLILTAYDGISLLNRRIVAYPSNNEPPNQAYTEKQGNASALMFETVRENMIDLMLVAARSMSPYLTFWTNPFAGPDLKISIAWNNVLDVLQGIAAEAAAQGSYLAFDVVSPAPNQLIFRVYPNQRGVNRRYPFGSNPIILSIDNGSLSEVLSDLDYSNEITHIYIGGQGTGTERIFVDLGDPTRETVTPFNRIEEFRSASGDPGHGDDPFQLLEAARFLREGRPREQWTATVEQTPNQRFGIHYNYGDYVNIQVGKNLYEVRLDAVKVNFGPEGERVDIKLRSNN